jgi:antitoxin MazE
MLADDVVDTHPSSDQMMLGVDRRRLEPAVDVSVGGWIAPRLGPFDGWVASARPPESLLHRSLAAWQWCSRDTHDMVEFPLTVQGRGTLALPTEIRRRHRLDEPGAQVRLVERDDGVIELHPLVAVPADQVWFWSERWQLMEREAEADVAAGRVAVTDGPDEFLEELDATA